MKIEDIRDRASFERWLWQQASFQVSVSNAARAGLRVQPLLWNGLEPKQSSFGLSALPFFRLALVAAGATSKVSSTAHRAADASVESAYEDAARVHDRAAYAIAYAVDSARRATSDAHSSASAAALAAADTAETAQGIVAKEACWQVLRADCAVLKSYQNIWATPLWSGGAVFSAEWVAVKSAWENVGTPWDTFARIYDDFWNGREPDWDYLERIVLIDPEIWGAGPDSVAAAIARIDEQLGLRDALRFEKDAFEQAHSASGLRGIGDNQGPPLGDRAVLPDFASISFTINQLTTALDEPELEHARVRSLAEKLLEMINGAKKGLLALAGLTIGGAAAAAGWDIYTTGGEQLIANFDRIADLAERIRQFAAF